MNFVNRREKENMNGPENILRSNFAHVGNSFLSCESFPGWPFNDASCSGHVRKTDDEYTLLGSEGAERSNFRAHWFSASTACVMEDFTGVICL